MLSGWSSALCPDGSQAAARWAAPCPVTKSTCFLPLTFMPNPEGNLELGEDRQNHPFISACGQRTANAVSGKFIFPSFIWELIKDVYSQGILWRLCKSELAKKTCVDNPVDFLRFHFATVPWHCHWSLGSASNFLIQKVLFLKCGVNHIANSILYPSILSSLSGRNVLYCSQMMMGKCFVIVLRIGK